MLYGIDISHHQGGFDLARVRREGFDFALFKATEGHSFVDERFAGNLSAGRGAGLVCAAYHYQRGDSSAAAQLGHVQRVVPTDCPIVLDVEANSGTVALTRDLTARLHGAGYRTPLLYLPRWYWQQIGSPDLGGLPPLWSSRYPDNEGGYASEIYQRVPAHFWDGYGGLGVDVLQFTSSATVAGHTPVDANAFRGDRAQLLALFGGNSSTPGGIESMAFTDSFTDWAQNKQTVLSWMNNVDQRIFNIERAVLGLQRSRIPGDQNTTNAANLWFDAGSWSNQTLGHVLAIRAALAQQQGIAPEAVTEALRPALAEVIAPVVAEAVAEALGSDNAEVAEQIMTRITEQLSGPAAEA